MFWVRAVRKRLSTSLILSGILLGACGNIAPRPTAAVTMRPSSTPTFALALPTLTPPSPTKSLLLTTPTTAERIRLYHNQIASRTIRDRYSFSVVVMDKKADFVPKSIQIIEQRSSLLIGQYELFNENEIESLCSSLLQNPALIFYETALIDYSALPKGFGVRAYEGDFIFRITLEHLSGTQEVIEFTTPLDACYSKGQ